MKLESRTFSVFPLIVSLYLKFKAVRGASHFMGIELGNVEPSIFKFLIFSGVVVRLMLETSLSVFCTSFSAVHKAVTVMT